MHKMLFEPNTDYEPKEFEYEDSDYDSVDDEDHFDITLPSDENTNVLLVHTEEIGTFLHC